MSSEQFAVIELTNQGDHFCAVVCSVDGYEIEVAVLGPGEATSQLTPSGVSWALVQLDQHEDDDPHAPRPQRSIRMGG